MLFGEESWIRFEFLEKVNGAGVGQWDIQSNFFRMVLAQRLSSKLCLFDKAIT